MWKRTSEEDWGGEGGIYRLPCHDDPEVGWAWMGLSKGVLPAASWLVHLQHRAAVCERVYFICMCVRERERKGVMHVRECLHMCARGKGYVCERGRVDSLH